MTGFFGATAYLFARSVVNRTRRMLRRLREPRFLVGLIAFVSYLAAVSNSAAIVPRSPGMEAGRWLLLSFVLVPVLSAWVLGGDDEVVAFSEAEVQFLFPAPATRRSLLLYKVVHRGVTALLFVAFSTAVMGSRFSSHPLYFAVGIWFAFQTVDLHVAGSSRVRAWLAARGLSGWVRRLVTSAVVAAAAIGIGWSTVLRAPPAAGDDVASQLAWWGGLLGTAPLSWALAPFEAAPRVAVAQDFASFVARLPAAAAVLGIHVLWVLSANRFEDGTVNAASRLGAMREGGRDRFGILRLSAVQLPLGARGPAWVGLAWKGLIGSIRVAPVRLVVVLGTMSIAVGVGAASFVDGAGTLAALIAVLIAFYLAGLGPAVLRTDLRMDIGMIDVLRALPVRGREVVAGEVCGPWLLLTLGEWACLGAALVLAGDVAHLPQEARIAGAGMLAVELPVATLVGLLVQNAAVLWFPEVEGPGGFDLAGRRLLTLVATLLVLIGAGVPTGLAMLPAAAAAGWVGLGVWPLAALAGVAPVLIAAWFALGAMGARLDALDPAEVR